MEAGLEVEDVDVVVGAGAELLALFGLLLVQLESGTHVEIKSTSSKKSKANYGISSRLS